MAQLAALSLQGRADVAGFIAGFAGDDRYVVDYLVEEVLGRQPDAVTRGDDSRAVLEMLDRSDLFVVPLDDSRHWYRFTGGGQDTRVVWGCRP